jgi:hypothetical protein
MHLSRLRDRCQRLLGGPAPSLVRFKGSGAEGTARLRKRLLLQRLRVVHGNLIAVLATIVVVGSASRAVESWGERWDACEEQVWPSSGRSR